MWVTRVQQLHRVRSLFVLSSCQHPSIQCFFGTGLTLALRPYALIWRSQNFLFCLHHQNVPVYARTKKTFSVNSSIVYQYLMLRDFSFRVVPAGDVLNSQSLFLRVTLCRVQYVLCWRVRASDCLPVSLLHSCFLSKRPNTSSSNECRIVGTSCLTSNVTRMNARQCEKY